MKSPVDDADRRAPQRPSPQTNPIGWTMRRAVGRTVMGAVLSVLILLVGGESAAAHVPHSMLGRSETDTPATTQTPAPAPAPTPTPTSSTTHEQQNGERRVQRDDLGFLGTVFLVWIGFLLALGATGVVLAGRARRRRDRAAETGPFDEA
ncbi:MULTISPECIES: hypothetical protein [unclassified Microbacterium]|uniref:hypothetical protein n=1 Tax=unclassified Microbacterium TaxID=2609290 RepID=UPI00109BE062|nr:MULTISPECIES: hypothetical protein [unclassified Microbacterium]